MRNVLLLLVFLLTIMLAPKFANAEEVYVAGYPCPNKFGTTLLSSDGTGILACLKSSPTNDTLVWKSQAGAGATRCYQVAYNGSFGLTLLNAPEGFNNASNVVKANTYATLSSLLKDYPSMSKWTKTPEGPYIAMKCINGLTRTSCIIATDGSDNDIYPIDNGCMIDDEESKGIKSWGGLFITCCE